MFLGRVSHNKLYEYDPESNAFALIKTKGSVPSGRSKAAVVQRDNNVYLHGGIASDCQPRNDFFILDMETLIWTRIKATGLPRGIEGHTLSRMSSSQMMLVGGKMESMGSSNAVLIFDAVKEEWREEAPISPEAGVNGCYNHYAFPIPTDEGVVIVIIGGRDDAKPSDLMLLFEISY